MRVSASRFRAGSGILFAVTVIQQTAQTTTSDLAIGQTVLVPIQG
jgi:hypothetical protein